jgi:hypothetical protein
MAVIPPRTRWLSLSLSWALAAAVTGASLPAWAQAQPEIDLEARDAEAKRACDAGRVQEGERLLTDLLRRTNDGTYIFNLGRCFQQNGQVDKALPLFRSYLRRPDVDPVAAGRARQYIAALERSPQAGAGDPAARRPSDVAAADLSASPDLVAPAPAPTSPGRTLRIAALVTGGVGLLGLATGGYYAQQTQKLEREKRDALNRQETSTEWFRAQDQRGERAEQRQWLFLGVGGAALAAGGVLYYLGVRAGHDEGHLQAAQALPLALPGIVGAQLAGRF